ncbi:MAG: hypothetical protein KY455_03680 [Euryarchaeota archaeon]|nr:hypothetical protein [Euryarchaeota archaeon]
MIDPARIPTLIAALGMLALAAWILLLRPSDRLHRALSLFLLFRGLVEGIAAFLLTGPDVLDRLLSYAIIAVPFAALNLGIVFHRRYYGPARHGLPLHRIARWSVLIAVVTVETLYLLDHGLWFDTIRFQQGPLSLLQEVTPLSYVVVALLVGRLALGRPGHTTRHALALFALGFALQPTFDVTYFLLINVWAGLDTSGIGIAALVVELVSLFLLGVFILMLHRAGMYRYALATIMPAITAVTAFLLLYLRSPYSFVTATTIAAVWHLALVVLAVYAVLKFQLFDIDLKVKSAVQKGAITAGIATILFVVSELLEDTFAGDAPLLFGVLAAGIIALALRPFLVLSERLADRILPGVEDSPDYRDTRSRDLYTAAVEGAYQDTEITGGERQMLDSLRSGLGLDAIEADMIEARVAVRASRRGVAVGREIDGAASETV